MVYTTSFVTLLLPAMAASRSVSMAKTASSDPLREFRIARPINALFAGMMLAEFAMLRVGMRFPVGGSRLVTAVKAA